jgi:hypothetical protein
MHIRLIEDTIESGKQKQREFFNLADRFRKATDPQEVKRLGDQLAGWCFRRLIPKIVETVRATGIFLLNLLLACGQPSTHRVHGAAR